MNQTVEETSSGSAEAAGAIASASTGVAAAALTVVTTACCVPVIAPIIVSVLGASGAVWAAGLKPYGWWILGAAFVCLAFGFWTVYRPRRRCTLSEIPQQQRVLSRVAKVSLWFGGASWMAAVIVRLVLPS